MFPGCTSLDMRARQDDLLREARHSPEPHRHDEVGLDHGSRALQLWFVQCVTALVRLEMALVAFMGL